MSLQPKEVEGFDPFRRASALSMKNPIMPPVMPLSRDTDEHDSLLVAKSLYLARRRRSKAFADFSLAFHEPPWDMLLDLYVARKERRMVSATSACIAADVPTTSGLRWIATLRQRGLVDLSSDPTDGRRTIVRLSDSATEAMERYLESI